jgi:hypothetical protein
MTIHHPQAFAKWADNRFGPGWNTGEELLKTYGKVQLDKAYQYSRFNQ